MKKLLAPIICALFMTGCGTQAAQVPPESPPTEIPISTLAPVTATSTATPTPPPAPTDAPAVIAQITEPPLPAVESQPTHTPTLTPTPRSTATPTPQPDWLNTYGRTADNLMYLGNPNAPVTMIDFSDFM